MQETAEKFKCELCNFSCSRQSNFGTHLMTKKHIKMQKDMPVTQVIITPPTYDNDKSLLCMWQEICKQVWIYPII
jgi:hypothetical protein